MMKMEKCRWCGKEVWSDGLCPNSFCAKCCGCDPEAAHFSTTSDEWKDANPTIIQDLVDLCEIIRDDGLVDADESVRTKVKGDDAMMKMEKCQGCHKQTRRDQLCSNSFCAECCGCGQSIEQHNQLSNAFYELVPDVRLVLIEFAERLLMGQRKYGNLDIDTDKRDWMQEAHEEDLDATVYRLFNYIKVERGKTK